MQQNQSQTKIKKKNEKKSAATIELNRTLNLSCFVFCVLRAMSVVDVVSPRKKKKMKKNYNTLLKTKKKKNLKISTCQTYVSI